MNSTPMHIFMYDAFGWKAPGFAHVGLLTDKEGQKLSKRHSHTDISTYRDELGIVPEVLTNFLALLGWSHQNKNDVMNLQELTNNVCLKTIVPFPCPSFQIFTDNSQFNMKFTKGNTVVDFGKLHYLQRQHTVRYAIAGLEGDTSKITFLTTSIEAELSKRDLDIPLSQILHGRDKNTYLLNLIKIDKRYELAPDFVARNEFYFRRPTADDLEKSSANPLNGTYATLTPPLPQAALELAAAFDPILVLGDEAWNPVVLSAHMGGIVAEMAKEKGKVELENDVDEKSRKDYVKRWATAVHEYLRWALCAGKPGPAGHEAMALLGREETLARLRAAENFLRKGPEEKIENRVDIV
jgi:glutamyl-tRNA synthetase